MKSKCAFFLVFLLPLVVFGGLGAVIFGYQAYSEKQENKAIQNTVAKAVHARGAVELANLERVQNGFGVCGIYRVADGDKGYSSFYYDAINKKVVLDVQSRKFESNCGLATLCDTI
ncbi:hypothetical protein EZI54_15180 [Marinobacter halodurans]|uniref:Uncharacterized protein n=1 Tax=Marinobacter halodurans TaxID=2528979 RepID=A0ABY1ZHQ6_9GAMM|nr:hypothetical protein [Marinobacter halodurans]TBW53324.1 hypothetical protein EZI54_15180 [Marinobacter halodurans]